MRGMSDTIKDMSSVFGLEDVSGLEKEPIGGNMYSKVCVDHLPRRYYSTGASSWTSGCFSHTAGNIFATSNSCG